MPVEHLKPKGLHNNPAFTQAIIVPAGARILTIGGQNAVDAEGKIVGKGDLGKQSAKALDNMILCLEAADAELEHLTKVMLYIVGDQDITPGFNAWMERWDKRKNPPIVTMARVVGLANPDYLIEIEATAVLP